MKISKAGLIYFLAVSILAGGVAAYAQQQPPAPSAGSVTPFDCSGTIVTGNTAQNIIAANSNMRGFVIQNIDTTEGMWISFTGTATASTQGSYFLQPASATAQGGSFTSPSGAGFNTAISAVAATSAHKFSCTRY